jgi:hypothetical protein
VAVADPDEFQLVVEALAREFSGAVDYDVVARVAVDEWARFRREGGRRWTAWQVADAAGQRLRQTVAMRVAS